MPSSAAKSASDQSPVIPMLINGEWVAPSRVYDVVDPYRGEVVWQAPNTTAAELEKAISSAVAAKKIIAAMPGYERAAILRRVGALLAERTAHIAEVMARETGKALRDANGEVARSQDTIDLSAEEAIRIEGAHVPLDGSQMGAGKIAMMLRFPVGVVAGITPFNAPFNLACHKVAPAIAAGNSIVLKASPQAPMVVHELAKMFVDAGCPKGAVNVVYGAEAGPALVRDPRIDFVTFTGSSRVGADIKAGSGLRRVALELGGNGPTIIAADADIAQAAPICARSSMRLAGQSCISVQTVHVHRSLYEPFLAALVAGVKALKLGDPLDQSTDVGTLIDENAARRVESWVAEAANQGAKIMTGGKRHGAAFEPTVLANVNATMKVVCDEVFGPVVSVMPFDNLDDVLTMISDSNFGLQCGLFTRSIETAITTIRSLRTGGVIVNGPSTWRTDQLPYGGIKDSGIGREGPRYAIREMTDERLVVFNM
ncbi:MAG: aldehyde dehydrogenase family protein [Proteobacteria bacterium]|nr:aldehyde dehydrogenase family protein [Pseudomonadota bacterium]